MGIQGVVFDMDGLMLDSEVLYEEVSLRIMAELGVEPSRELVRHSIGLPENTWGGMVHQHYGPAFDIQRFKQRCYEEMDVWYAQKPIAIKPGLFELLEYLREQGIPCAVASSTYRSRATCALERLGIAPYLRIGVFGDMVEHGKPAPDIYLRAVAELGLEPQFCMGLEDSHNGVRASHTAGLYTVMVPDLLPPTDEILKLTDDCVASLFEVVPILEELNAPATV